jgi:hypothetical protein
MSSRPANLIASPSKLDRALHDPLKLVQRRLENLYSEPLFARAIELQIHIIAQRLGIAPPVERRLRTSFEWVQANWEALETMILETRDRNDGEKLLIPFFLVYFFS